MTEEKRKLRWAFWLSMGILLMPAIGWAGLKVWSAGQGLLSTDLNNNFSFLNTTKVGGGVLLVNSHVSNSAAIAHSKLAAPALIPKAWVVMTGSVCDCSQAAGTLCPNWTGYNINKVTASGLAGICRVYLNYTVNNVLFSVSTSAITDTSTIATWTSGVTGVAGTNYFFVNTYNAFSDALVNTRFSLVVMDDDSGP